MNQSQIMTAYLALESKARSLRGRLMPEDVTACIESTASALGLPVATVADAVRTMSAGMQG